MYKTFILLLLFIVPSRVMAQILPAEGSKLNYRIVGFSFPQKSETGKYTLELASGIHNSVDSFEKNIFQRVDGRGSKIIAEVPSFGAGYTWRVAYSAKKKSPLYHFSTQMNPRVDSSNFRLRILQPSAQYKDLYIALDAGEALYDLNGRPVWFVPDTNGIDGYAADMQFTPQNTITFLDKNAYEIDGNGAVLWKAPNNGIFNGDKQRGDFYHHEFTRLSNGHYMVLGMQVVLCKTVVTKDTSYMLLSDDKVEKGGFKRGRFGVIAEFDQQGNVVWSWKTLDYLRGSDYNYFKPIDSNLRYDPHDNAFFFDERNKCIYLGFRNLNRVMKIEYPSGKVLCSYGEAFRPGIPETGKGMFCNQHSIGRTHDGFLYVFNNNSCHLTDSLPTVVMVNEPAFPGDSMKKVWEYTCSVEGNYKKRFYSGGNAVELPDHSLLVNMGSEYSKVFIVNREKQVLWSAFPERYIETDAIWLPNHQYRVNFIARKDLERLIWRAEGQASLNK